MTACFDSPLHRLLGLSLYYVRFIKCLSNASPESMSWGDSTSLSINALQSPHSSIHTILLHNPIRGTSKGKYNISVW